MAELHEEEVWHVPYTAEQIQASIGKNPVYSEVDENGDRYWMLWDISTSQYIKTNVKVFIGDIDQISAEADRAETAAASADEKATAAATSEANAKKSADEAQAIKESLDVITGPDTFRKLMTGRLI